MADTQIHSVATDKAPKPAGHYVQATIYQGLVYISGQLPVKPSGEHTFEAAFADQAKQAITNVLSVLEEAGSSPERLLKVTAYIVGVENWPQFNTLYAAMLGNSKPARAVVPVPELHFGYLIEIDAVAALA